MKAEQKHTHRNGEKTCCSLEEKIDTRTPPSLLKSEHSEDDGHNHSHEHSHSGSIWKVYLPATVITREILAE